MLKEEGSLPKEEGSLPLKIEKFPIFNDLFCTYFTYTYCLHTWPNFSVSRCFVVT